MMDAYLPEKLALTGATGALGFSFLRTQLARHPRLQAVLLVRKSSSAFRSPTFQQWLGAHRHRITLVEGDVRQATASQFGPLFETDGGLWHFAAMTSLVAENPSIARDIHEVNFQGTERLLEALRGNASSTPFYHISTAYVAGDRQGLIRESEAQMGQGFRNPYEAAKLKAEIAVRQAFASGLRGAIFRPSVVVDNTGGTSGIKMVDACAYAVVLALKRKEPFIFRLRRTAGLNLIHNDWVIAAMSDLARLPSGPGLTYHLTASHATRMEHIAHAAEKWAPQLKVGFEPDLSRAELPTASRLFDKAITDIRPYFDADVTFDRTHTDRDLSPDQEHAPLDVGAFVEGRLQSELVQFASR